jgi:hypothetical protein
VFIASSTACVVSAASANWPAVRPWWTTTTRSHQRGELVDVRRAHQHGHARVGRRADQRVHLGLGADFDAARRVVEQEDRGLRIEPLGEQRISADAGV